MGSKVKGNERRRVAVFFLSASIILRSFYVVTSAKFTTRSSHFARNPTAAKHPIRTHAEQQQMHSLSPLINSFNNTVKYWKFEMFGRKTSKRKWP